MQEITSILLNNMTYISIAIIGAMVIIFLIGIINNLSLKLEYSKIIKELDYINNDGMEVYTNKMLNEIVTSYKEAYLKSFDEVNTQAIIEAKFYKLDKGKIGKESFLSNLNTMLLTLGIVGTLYNLIVIATGLTEMFKGIDVAMAPSLASVLGNVSTIIAHLAIAFLSTFIAILLSFIYSVINSCTHVEMARANLFARLEDYLDNVLRVNLSRSRPKMGQAGMQGEVAHSNILYMLENTSNSMMSTTSKLEESITALSENLKTMISGQDSKGEEKVTEAEKKENIAIPLMKANDGTSENLDAKKSEMTENLGKIFDAEEEKKKEEEREKNQKLERLKLIEESKKMLEKKANEKLETMKNSDVVPNKDKTYVEEGTKEIPKASEFLKKEDVNFNSSNMMQTAVPANNGMNANNQVNIPMQTVMPPVAVPVAAVSVLPSQKDDNVNTNLNTNTNTQTNAIQNNTVENANVNTNLNSQQGASTSAQVSNNEVLKSNDTMNQTNVMVSNVSGVQQNVSSAPLNSNMNSNINSSINANAISNMNANLNEPKVEIENKQEASLNVTSNNTMPEQNNGVALSQDVPKEEGKVEETKIEENKSAATQIGNVSGEAGVENVVNDVNTQTNSSSDLIDNLKKEQAVRKLTVEDVDQLKKELIRRQEEERRIQEIMNSKKQ